LNITYFVNHYPKVSHTFIRREIQALESMGFRVKRVAIHCDKIKSSDKVDYFEMTKTKYILQPSILVLIISFLLTLGTDFSRVVSGFYLCFSMIKVSDRSTMKNLVYFLEGIRLAKICRKAKSEHIHAHFGTNSTDVVMYCSHISGIPYSFTVHGPEEFDRPISINLTEKIQRASVVFAISKFCKSQLQRWVTHDYWTKIKIVHCGLDDTFFDKSLPIKKINTNNVKVLFIGRLCEQKGPLVLMEALKLLTNKNISLNVTFAGDGELREAIEQYALMNDLSNKITITGWVDSSQIRALLLESDMMILPSFAEGLPVAIMEAFASKVPVITTRIAGIPELVKSKETGFIVSPGCELELTQAIEELLTMKFDERANMIENAYAAVFKEHQATLEAEKIVKFIRDVKC
jgi:colanic acid/amylovoran biosynthesis glycosyltransferase